MVAQNKIKPRTEKDAVCPDCFRHLEYPSYPQITQAEGNNIRTYHGWCYGCDKGFEVVQFEKACRWVIHKFRPYTVDKTTESYRPLGEWTVMNEMPEVPLIITGPGGEYANPVTGRQIDESIEKLLQSACAILNKTSKALCELLGAYRHGKNS